MEHWQVHEPATREILDQIEPIWPDSLTYAQQVADKDLLAHSQVVSDDVRPLFAWGIIPMWERVGSIWLVMDIRMIHSPGAIRRMLRHAVKALQRTQEHYTRLEGLFPVEVPTYKIAQLLEFQTEGLMRNYGRGGEGDYVRVARIQT